MRSPSVRLSILAATVCAGIALPIAAAAFAHGDTIFVQPTTRTVFYPSAYAVGSSYLLPSAYVVPTYYSAAYYPTTYYATSYYSTAYYPRAYYTTSYYPTVYYPTAYYSTDLVTVSPSTYLATVYERRGLLGRRRWLVEQPLVATYATTYVPTTYVVPTYYSTTSYTPTVYEYPVVRETAYVASSPTICDDVVAFAPSQPSAPAGASRSGAKGGSKRVESEAMEGPAISSEVAPVPGEATPPRVPPAPPAPAGERGAPLKGGAESKKAVGPAQGEERDSGLEVSPPVRRDTMRPAFSARALRGQMRNVLLGRVETNSGQAREEVRILVTNRDDRTISHEGTTDAFGQFAIRLSEGDWTVNVVMPSGRLSPVKATAPDGEPSRSDRVLRVRNGRIVDIEENREVPNLIISF